MIRFVSLFIATVISVALALHYNLPMVPAFIEGLGLGFLSYHVGSLFEDKAGAQ